jgi:hypothetical protein
VDAADLVEDQHVALRSLRPRTSQLLTFLGRQALALAAIDIGLVDPIAERLVGDPEVVCDPRDGLVRGADELDGPVPELIRVWRA